MLMNLFVTTAILLLAGGGGGNGRYYGDGTTTTTTSKNTFALFVHGEEYVPPRHPAAARDHHHEQQQQHQNPLDPRHLSQLTTEEQIAHVMNTEWNRAMSLPPGSPERIQILMNLHKLQPNNLGILINLGLETSETPAGIDVLENCFDSSVVSMTLPEHDKDMAWRIANYIGRYRHHQKDYDRAFKFFNIALDLSKDRFPGEGDVCSAMQLATLMENFPTSVEKADQTMEEMIKNAEAFLQRNNTALDDGLASDLLPKADKDPYSHCLLTLFYLSFFYRADIAKVASLHYNVTAAAWPDMVQVAPHVQQYDKYMEELEGDNVKLPCVNRKIRLGISAANMGENHPVTEDFSGVLSRLDRSKFNITYIYFDETGQPPGQFVFRHSQDKFILIHKDDRIDFRNSSWIRRYTPVVAASEFDIILYLDLTMSTHARRLGMQRLAPVQLNTHGHPITSGHPKTIVQKFVSWAEAELAPEESQQHYTEELVLIPNGTIHQYYTRRVLDGGKSRLDGMPYKHLTRADFDLPDDVRLYLNMQKPFKLHPEYDQIPCGILEKDEEGHLILHHSDEGHEIFVDRLTKAGCDLERIHFVPMQPHHRLLALYEFATIVLDSYPAGGCTTTREVLELGKAVVTLPARLLGGRWSLGLYNIIGLDDEAKEAVIASTPEEFIDKAVKLGTDDELRGEVEAAIAKAVQSLFGRDEAIEAWEKILLESSPYDICEDFRPAAAESDDEEEIMAVTERAAAEEEEEEEEEEAEVDAEGPAEIKPVTIPKGAVVEEVEDVEAELNELFPDDEDKGEGAADIKPVTIPEGAVVEEVEDVEAELKELFPDDGDETGDDDVEEEEDKDKGEGPAEIKPVTIPEGADVEEVEDVEAELKELFPDDDDDDDEEDEAESSPDGEDDISEEIVAASPTTGEATGEEEEEEEL